MNLAKKAVIFNLTLFPGWGQIFLRNYKKGIAIIIAVLAGISSLVWSIVEATIAILKTSPLKKGDVTFEAVVKVAFNAIKSLENSYLTLILLSIVSLWVFSIIDAYVTGKKQQSVIQDFAEKSDASDQQSTSPDSN